jgi:hypothetical protein
MVVAVMARVIIRGSDWAAGVVARRRVATISARHGTGLKRMRLRDFRIMEQAICHFSGRIGRRTVPVA